MGLGYLSLNRGAPTLSGGESQRIRLASQLGSNLQGVCYVLDEPTIGLHPRDNRRLIKSLTELKNKGNTVLVVEHDEDTIRAADHIVDIGPGAGSRGGELLCEGTLDELMAENAASRAKCFAIRRRTRAAHDVPSPKSRRNSKSKARTFTNLKKN